MNSVSAARQNVLQRGYGWVDNGVAYDMDSTTDGYRQDCSGFVSMCMDLGAPGESTSGIPGALNEISVDDLLPGDALSITAEQRGTEFGHAMLFVGWQDDAHSTACIIEEGSSSTGSHESVRSIDGFTPYRSPALANDTSLKTGNTGGSTTTPGATTPGTTITPPSTPGCVSQDIAGICFDAHAKSGLQCGTTTDNCGKTVDCSRVAGFTCANGSCLGNRCSGGTTNPGGSCVAKSVAQACIAAKELRDAECGSVDDGCGHKVSCEGQPEYGCESGKKCNSQNKCAVGGSTELGNTGSGKDHKDPLATKGDGPESDAQINAGKKGGKPFKTNNPVEKNDGCAAAPGSAGGTNTGTMLVGLALAAAFVRRRKNNE